MNLVGTAAPEVTSRPAWRELAQEPFRLFFPLAILAGVTGVSLWPLHFLGMVQYPGVAHARIMAHGFFGCFVLGFLGTALPRMLGVRPLAASLVGCLLLTQTASVGLHVAGFTKAADLSFLSGLILLLGAIGPRFRGRSDLPPPGFMLVALGLASVTTGILLGLPAVTDETDATRLVLQTRLAYQGFLLLPVLGVGGYVFPGLLGAPNRQDLPEMRGPDRLWRAKALEALAVGAVLIGSFFVEVYVSVAGGHALRGGASVFYLYRQAPLSWREGRHSTVAYGLRAGLVLMVGGLFAVAVLPQWRVALLHLTFASGLVLVTFAVATRVMFGHSGQPQRLHARNIGLMIAFGMLFFATLTRITGDFIPKILPTHYSYGAILWAAGALLWAWKMMPTVLRVEPE